MDGMDYKNNMALINLCFKLLNFIPHCLTGCWILFMDGLEKQYVINKFMFQVVDLYTALSRSQCALSLIATFISNVLEHWEFTCITWKWYIFGIVGHICPPKTMNDGRDRSSLITLVDMEGPNVVRLKKHMSIKAWIQPAHLSCMDSLSPAWTLFSN